MHGFIDESKNAIAGGGVLLGCVAAGEEAVVGIEGRVEEVEPVEFLEDLSIEQKDGRLGIAGVLPVEALQAIDSAGKVEIVEVLRCFADEGVSIEWVGMHGVCAGGRGEEQQSAAKEHSFHRNKCPFIVTANAFASIFPIETDSAKKSISNCLRTFDIRKF